MKKINRLEQAKRQIKEEQNACLGEIAKIKNPDLEKKLDGKPCRRLSRCPQ
ncbi:hypothetical protein RCO48_02925 [Peribacillus frigoritolerans]|nr:hypothetical protein [Peribacillus frigoritolerans]